MPSAVRYGKKVRVESTFQIKHRFLLWWLKRQAAKEANEAVAQPDIKAAAPIHIHAGF